jgi:hypothetical protein
MSFWRAGVTLDRRSTGRPARGTMLFYLSGFGAQSTSAGGRGAALSVPVRRYHPAMIPPIWHDEQGRP